MQLNLKALSLVAGIFTAAAIWIVGLANLSWSDYGAVFLQMMASIYPGCNAAGGPETGIHRNRRLKQGRI
jgi:hypothetical protein